jgi:alpha/beta superfamily hydrolase
MSHASHAKIQTIDLTGPAGRLEALLNVGSAQAEYAAVVTHPHPLFGGTMHNKVVFHAMKALNSFGFPVLRFNFRGTGTSQGVHDNGVGEVDDVRTAITFLKSEFHLPIIFAGFSFGAAAGLKAACPDREVEAIISIGTPMQADNRVYNYDFLRQCDKPKLFISGANDQFCSPEELHRLADSVGEPKTVVLIKDADHFFAGHLDEYRAAMEAWVKQTLGLDGNDAES